MFEKLQELPKCDTDMKVLKTGTNRLAQCSICEAQ